MFYSHFSIHPIHVHYTGLAVCNIQTCPHILAHKTQEGQGSHCWRRRGCHDNTTLSGKSRLFKLQTRSPHVSLVLNLARRQGCNSERQTTGATRLSTAEQQPPKKKDKEGNSRVTGVHQASRKQLTAQGLGQKRRGAVCYWKSWQETKAAGREEKERGCCLTLSWSVKASCSFLAAAQSHF